MRKIKQITLISSVLILLIASSAQALIPQDPADVGSIVNPDLLDIYGDSVTIFYIPNAFTPTNDDGINSAGLRAAVEALLPLGELLVVAPNRQWSGAGRAMPKIVSGEITPVPYRTAQGVEVRAYSMDATPALCVVAAMLQLASRPPDLLVSGINFGENVSTEVTISGTIGAALEGATFGIPSLAVSMEMSIAHHLVGNQEEDYLAAKAFTLRFSRLLLSKSLPFDVDVLSINLPSDATPETPWLLTRLSRHRYFIPTPPKEPGDAGYRVMDHPERAEVGSDIWCLHAARKVSVTPLSLDMTSRVDFGMLEELLRQED